MLHMSEIDLSHKTQDIKDLPAYCVSRSESKNEQNYSCYDK